MLVPEQIYRLRKSFAALERQGPVTALVYLQHVLRLDPASRVKAGTESEAQAVALLNRLSRILSLMEKPDELKAALTELRAPATDAHGMPAGVAFSPQALLLTLGEELGDQFDPDTRAAWVGFCSLPEGEGTRPQAAL